mgnify:CR=1 FL=1
MIPETIIAMTRAWLMAPTVRPAWMPDSAQLNDSMQQAQRAKKHLETYNHLFPPQDLFLHAHEAEQKSDTMKVQSFGILVILQISLRIFESQHTTHKLIAILEAYPRLARVMYWFYPDFYPKQPDANPELVEWWFRTRTPVPAACFNRTN